MLTSEHSGEENKWARIEETHNKLQTNLSVLQPPELSTDVHRLLPSNASPAWVIQELNTPPSGSSDLPPRGIGKVDDQENSGADWLSGDEIESPRMSSQALSQTSTHITDPWMPSGIVDAQDYEDAFAGEGTVHAAPDISECPLEVADKVPRLLHGCTRSGEVSDAQPEQGSGLGRLRDRTAVSESSDHDSEDPSSSFPVRLPGAKIAKRGRARSSDSATKQLNESHGTGRLRHGNRPSGRSTPLEGSRPHKRNKTGELHSESQSSGGMSDFLDIEAIHSDHESSPGSDIEEPGDGRASSRLLARSREATVSADDDEYGEDRVRTQDNMSFSSWDERAIDMDEYEEDSFLVADSEDLL